MTALLLLTATALTAVSCGKEKPAPVDPIAHNGSFDIWPDSIDLHNGVILRAMSDSLLEVRVTGNVLDSVSAGRPADNRMTFRSGMPLLDFLYRLEASMPPATRYGAATPYDIYLNPAQNDSARAVLLSRLRNGLVIPYEGRQGAWPMVNVNAEWLLAASELVRFNGDAQMRKTVESTARASVANDLRLSYDPAASLFLGIPRYIASMRGIYPRWMEPSRIYQQTTLAVNTAYIAALRNIAPDNAVSTDSLRKALDNTLWIPNMGYYSATAYGVAPYRIPLQSTDNLAQAIAVISGQLSDAMAATIVRKTPVTEFGVALMQPQLPPASGEVKDEIGPMLMQAAWTVACARTGNESAYSAACGALFAREGERLLANRHQLPSFRSTFTIFILRALAGMQFAPDGIYFTPFVPQSMPGEKHIGNFRYRDAILDIHITGTGRAIATFSIDGKPAEPFFPADLKGKHEISITLAGPAADPGFHTVQATLPMAPLPPEARWESTRTARLKPGRLPSSPPAGTLSEETRALLTDGDQNCRLVYINGVLQEEIFRDEYRLYDAPQTAVVQFTSFVNSQLSGFSSDPYIYIPRNDRHMIYASSLAKSGTKILEDKKLAAKFVESNRFKNRNISFDFTADRTGRYMIEIRYVNGLGIVNSQRRLALRQLRVDGRDEGVFFFPQLSQHSATRDSVESWQEQTAWTNTLTANLREGVNRMELRYYQPSPVYADPSSNTILFDLIRITPLD